ncbi:C39 family peptidase [Desulfovibrio ferrophilus]|uniref:Peptidase C39 domain-containing protein n=1 Tax=Desulfovibrio ferrophilus TaxID=241368 RepID=A0A2Z6B2A3_9BACT|nr:C39 family peptidase [Desulfovibrio ferrophilus]BBD09536.1 uncharacterized protein DFE_2810 [Desulfovibrio ferrophilus]
MTNRNALFSFCAIFVLLAGCTAGKQIHVPAEYQPSGTKVLNVPHIQQNNGYACAAISLAQIMSFYDNTNYSGDEVWDRSGASATDVEKRGNNIPSLSKAAQSYGFNDMQFMTTNLGTIEYLIDNGIPVLVNVRQKRGSHAVVIDGYNSTQIHIVDPIRGYFWEDKDSFKKRWWANLSHPKGKKWNSAFVLMPKGTNLFTKS